MRVYVLVSRKWADGDKLVLVLPMRLGVRRWERNKNSVSVDYGPLSFSLLIGEKYEKKGTKETAIGGFGVGRTALMRRSGRAMRSIRLPRGIMGWNCLPVMRRRRLRLRGGGVAGG